MSFIYTEGPYNPSMHRSEMILMKLSLKWFINHNLSQRSASRCCEIVVWECGMWWWPARPFIHSSWAAAGHTGISSSGAMLVWTGQHKQLCVPGCISRLSIKTSRAWERFGRGEQRSRQKICKGRETNKANCHLFKLSKVLFFSFKIQFF